MAGRRVSKGGDPAYAERRRVANARWWAEKRYSEVQKFIAELAEQGVDSKEAFELALEQFPAMGKEERSVVSAEGGRGGVMGDVGMIPASMFAGRARASQREVVEWVASNMAVQDVDVEGCPSSEAWGMLRWTRLNVANEGDFWRVIYSKLLPTRTEVGREAMKGDEAQLELLEQRLREIKARCKNGEAAVCVGEGDV